MRSSRTENTGFSSIFNANSGTALQRNAAPETKLFGIRLTDNERACLDERAGNEPTSVWARRKLLDEDERDYKRRPRRKPRVSDQNLAMVLSLFGDQRIASNLNQLAKHANIGTLDYDDETLEQLLEACAAMIAVRKYLLGE